MKKICKHLITDQLIIEKVLALLLGSLILGPFKDSHGEFAAWMGLFQREGEDEVPL